MEDKVIQDNNYKSVRPVLIASKKTIEKYSIYLRHLLVGLADNSIPAVLIYPADIDIDSVTTASAELLAYPAFNLPLMWRANRNILTAHLDKFKPTILHCLCESRANFTRRLSRAINLPYILNVNSLGGLTGRFSISAKLCRSIIVPSSGIKETVLGSYPKYSDRIEQLNFGSFVNEDDLCFSCQDRPASLACKEPEVWCEQFEKFLTAVKHLIVNGHEFITVIVSNENGKNHLRRTIIDMGLSQHIIIIPHLTPWKTVISACDIFVQPYPENDFNSFMLEAMSAGLAIVSCSLQTDEPVIDGRTAALFDASDALKIHDCLKDLLDRREHARDMAKKAMQYIKENHSVSGMLDGILKIYQDTSYPSDS